MTCIFTAIRCHIFPIVRFTSEMTKPAHNQKLIPRTAAGLARSITDQLRTCDIVAESDVCCWELRVNDFMDVVGTDMQVPQKSPAKSKELF